MSVAIEDSNITVAEFNPQGSFIVSYEDGPEWFLRGQRVFIRYLYTNFLLVLTGVAYVTVAGWIEFWEGDYVFRVTSICIAELYCLAAASYSMNPTLASKQLKTEKALVLTLLMVVRGSMSVAMWWPLWVPSSILSIVVFTLIPIIADSSTILLTSSLGRIVKFLAWLISGVGAGVSLVAVPNRGSVALFALGSRLVTLGEVFSLCSEFLLVLFLSLALNSLRNPQSLNFYKSPYTHSTKRVTMGADHA